MKKALFLLIAITMVLTFAVSCAPKSDEEQIMDRIDKFLSNYNAGDMDGTIAHTDAKTRNTFKAMMNIMGSIAGGYAGFDIDLSDFWSLGVSTSQGQFIDIDVEEIVIVDSTNAVAIGTLDLANNETENIYVVMVYENDGWYIHDMTDVKPSILNKASA